MSTDSTTGRETHLPAHPTASRSERAAAGKARRDAAPLSSHADLDPADSRDPVGLLLTQAESRLQDLVPLRHGRMLVSPFTYFRGAALPMAADLAESPRSGLQVQLCGDAHLANFGAFGSPERRLVFSINDFDETLPGPFEWDVKRLASSVVIAARDNGFTRKEQRRAALASAESYRKAMRDFAEAGLLDGWYAHLDFDAYVREIRDELTAKRAKALDALLAKARTRDSVQAARKLTEVVDGRRRLVSDPPLVVPVEELLPEVEAGALQRHLDGVVARYGRSLSDDRRHLLHQFRLVHVARKVVGVGSVGTRAFVLLMEADGGDELLMLQAKEAQASVLAPYLEESHYDNQGQRVVAGQRLMQAVSDILLGWDRFEVGDSTERDAFVRQLRDWKLSLPIERMKPHGLAVYARACGWTLARAHARSGDRIAIASYLGGSDKFDQAIVEFAEAYADLNEHDHALLAQAVEQGRTTAETVD